MTGCKSGFVCQISGRFSGRAQSFMSHICDAVIKKGKKMLLFFLFFQVTFTASALGGNQSGFTM